MAIQQAPVSIGHPLVGDMAAGLAALADVVAGSSHKQEISAVRLAESGGQGWLSSVVSDVAVMCGGIHAAPAPFVAVLAEKALVIRQTVSRGAFQWAAPLPFSSPRILMVQAHVHVHHWSHQQHVP